MTTPFSASDGASSGRGIPEQQDIINDLCRMVGLTSDQAGGLVTITGVDPVVASPHRLGDATAAALATLGISLGALWRLRTGETQDVHVDIDGAIQQLSAVYLSRVSGLPCQLLLDDPGCWETNDFFRSRTGRYVFIVNSLPPLRDIACTVLDCPPTHAAYADRIGRWDPFELEEAIASRGGCCAAVRTAQEWEAHEQGRVLAGQPVIRLQRIGDAPPIPFTGRPGNAFSGLRVLDNTHVIAGPIAARIMAEYGADVLHISRPGHADPTVVTIETGLGKRNAYCRLDDPSDVQRFWSVLDRTDVWVNSYLNLEERGFGIKQLASARPGLIALDFRCYGHEGPWANRGGFDQLAQAVTGFAAEEGGFDSPKLPPTHLVNDYLAAILGTIGVTAALIRRASEGGSWQIHIDLVQVCTWVRHLGIIDPNAQSKASSRPASKRPSMRSISTAFGPLDYLPTQMTLSRLEPNFSHGSMPWGADTLSWS